MTMRSQAPTQLPQRLQVHLAEGISEVRFPLTQQLKLAVSGCPLYRANDKWLSQEKQTQSQAGDASHQ